MGDIQRSNGAVDEDGGSFFLVRVMLDVTCLCVEVESLPYPVERRDGLDSNMNDY